ncbi:MAG: N-acetylmuramoyl-L-alanine amidase [Rhodothermales bacterium]|nr:N-acetylmuramoyl-L-alanine amidase [Rhodothermales bacterium]MBO6779536.1 N-acetylmuramoyl-L-alanine amidase [Rhodothermales bacterium]
MLTGLLFLALLNPLAGERAPRLHAVSFVESASGHRQVLRLHLDNRVAAFSDPRQNGDGAWEVTLYNVKRSRDFAGAAPRAPIEAYRARPERAHLVIEFRTDGPILADAYRDDASDDLLVAITQTGLPVATELEAAAAILPASGQPVSAPAEEAPTPVLQPATTSVSQAASRWRIDRIAIDAGHGGHDPGAVGSGRLREKDVVLPVARKLGQYLEERLGVEVIYTRTDDSFVELRERGRIANRAEADLFISIHANMARNTGAHGTETYFLGMNKGGSAQGVIERENSVIQMESDQSHYDQFDQAALIRLQLAQSAFLRQSEELAALIEHQFEDRVQRKSRGVKEGNFQVLWAAAMPAVLVELGFISNPTEARFLRTAQGVDYMASAIFRAIRDYKATVEGSLLSAQD